MKTIFVSSTFRDMDLERDTIQEIVSPALNREARRHGQSISFCDLRWGIDTSALESESGSKKVLDVCLDEIDRCQPPMVVILGYRYGWIPSGDLVSRTAKRYAMELDDLEKSVTALEIEYGALADRARLENTLFYFREITGDVPGDYLAEDEDHACRVRALKDRIRSLTGDRVRTYTLEWRDGHLEGIQGFADMLCSDLKAMLLPQWQKYDAMSPFEKERHIHETFLREKAEAFRARKEFVGQILKQIEDGREITILKGPVGSGKSTLFSYLAQQLRQRDWEVFPIFSNLTMETYTAQDILQLMVRYLEDSMELGHFDANSERGRDLASQEVEKVRAMIAGAQNADETTFGVKDWQKRLEELCSIRAKAGRRIVFMLDAADQLFPDDNRDDLVFIPGGLGENVRFLMTCLPELKTAGHPAIGIPPISQADKREVVAGILASHNRELSPAVTARMLELEGSDNPLYLSFLVQRLLMMNKEDFDSIRSQGDGMDAISRQQLAVLETCPDSLTRMSDALMRAAANRVGGNMVYRALNYLALAPAGLRVSDLSGVLGSDFNMLDFSHFISYMRDCFVVRSDGRYDFSHKSIREGLLDSCTDPRELHKKLLEHFNSLEQDDPVRRQEIIHHCICADDKPFFVEYVTKYMFEDKQAIRCAAQNAYNLSLQDGGAWLCDMLAQADSIQEDNRVTKFIYSYFQKLCVFKLSELKVQLAVFAANLALAERMEKRLDTRSSRFSLGHSIHILADCYAYIADPADHEKTVGLRRRQLAVFEKLCAGEQTEVSRRYLAEAHEQLANALSTGDTEERRSHMEQALTLRNALAQENQDEDSWIAVGDLCLAYAEEHIGLFHTHADEAQKCVDKAIEIFEILYNWKHNSIHLTRLANAYDCLARCAVRCGEYELAEKHRKKRISLLEEAIQFDRSISRRQILAYAYMEAAYGSHWSDAAYARKAVDMYRNIVEERGSVKDCLNLATALEYSARLLPEDQQDEKLRVLEEAIQIRESMPRERQETALAKAYGSLVSGWRKVDAARAEVYQKKYDEIDISKKMNAYTEVLEVLRHMSREYIETLPRDIIMFFFENCNMDSDFRMTKSFSEEKLSDDTLDILALLNQFYWQPNIGKTS